MSLVLCRLMEDIMSSKNCISEVQWKAFQLASCSSKHTSPVLISFVQISLKKSSRNEWFGAADSSWNFYCCCLAIAPFPGSSGCLRSPQEKVFGLKGCTSRQQLWKMCCCPVYESCYSDLLCSKNSWKLLWHAEKKKIPLQNPLFQSVIKKGAALPFPPVALKRSGFMRFQLQTQNVSAATRGRAERWWGWGCRFCLQLAAAQASAWLVHDAWFAWPKSTSCFWLGSSALGERVGRDDKQFKQFWLGHAWKYFYLYDCKLQTRISAYSREIQALHDKIYLFKGKTPRGFRSALSRTWPPPFLSQPLGRCIHKIISWCRMGMEFFVFTKRLALPQTDTTLPCLAWIMNLELKCC